MLKLLEQIRNDLAKLRLDVATLLAMDRAWRWKGPVVTCGQAPIDRSRNW